jgi:RNA polymerase primary sigma factor
MTEREIDPEEARWKTDVAEFYTATKGKAEALNAVFVRPETGRAARGEDRRTPHTIKYINPRTGRCWRAEAVELSLIAASYAGLITYCPPGKRKPTWPYLRSKVSSKSRAGNSVWLREYSNFKPGAAQIIREVEFGRAQLRQSSRYLHHEPAARAEVMSLRREELARGNPAAQPVNDAETLARIAERDAQSAAHKPVATAAKLSGRVEMLTPEGIGSLVQRAHNGSREARSLLLASFRPMVLRIAKELHSSYDNAKLDISDLIAEGYLALADSFQTFNPALGAFPSYAETRVRWQITAYCVRASKHVRAGAMSLNQSFDYDGDNDNDRPLEDLLHTGGINGHTGKPLTKAEMTRAGRCMADDEPRNVVALEQWRRTVADTDLDARERHIITARCDGSDRKIIGKELGVSAERVRQIENRAIAKLRKAGGKA